MEKYKAQRQQGDGSGEGEGKKAFTKETIEDIDE